MSVEACIARKVVEMIQPHHELKQKQFDEIQSKQVNVWGVHGDFGYEKCYLVMNIQQSKPEIVRMVFVCKEFAIVSEIIDRPNVMNAGGCDYCHLQKIHLGTEWESKFVEWVDEDWVTSYDGTDRPYTREHIEEDDEGLSSFLLNPVRVLELFV